MTCVPTIMNGAAVPQCVAAGSGMSSASCASSGDCAPGYLCDASGSCRKLCCGGDWSACTSASEHCFVGLSIAESKDSAPIDTNAMLCAAVNTCDALVPQSCEKPGTTCQIVDPTGATACLPEGSGDVGQACPCKGGSVCVDGVCRRLCKAVAGGGDPACAPGEGNCVHNSRDPMNVGECTP
jgi:hypothetical protein